MRDAADILEGLGLQAHAAPDNPARAPESPLERALLELIESGTSARDLDALAAGTGRDVAAITQTLVRLEIAGRVGR